VTTAAPNTAGSHRSAPPKPPKTAARAIAKVTPSTANGRELAGVGRGSRLGLLGAGFSALANFALVLVVTHGFGRHDAGLFFAATAAFLVLQMLCKIGTDTALVYFIARLRALGETDQIGAHLRVALAPVVLLAVGLGAISFGLSHWLAHAVFGSGASRQLQVLAIAVPFAVVYDVCLAATRGFGTVTPYILLERLLRPGLQLVFLIAVVAFGGSATMLATAWAGPFLLLLPVVIALLLRLLRSEGIAAAAPKSGLRRAFWSFSATRGVTGLAQALLQRLDVVLVVALLGPTDAAIYAAASRFLVLGQLGNQAISAPVEPRLAGLLARRNLRGALEIYRLSTSWLVIISWPLFLVAAIYSPTIMRIFGPGYTSGWPVVLTLCLCMLPASAVGLVDVVLVMAGRTSWNLWNTLAALVINVSLDLLLIPHLGLVGAAIGWGAAVLATNLVPLAQIHHLLRLQPFGRSVGSAILLSLAAFAVVPGLVRLVLGGGFPSLVIALLLAAPLYLYLLHRERGALQLHLLLGKLVKAAPLPQPAPEGRHRRPEPAAADWTAQT
jgi:O-antigen/teichoic acid export membrane protein